MKIEIQASGESKSAIINELEWLVEQMSLNTNQDKWEVKGLTAQASAVVVKEGE